MISQLVITFTKVRHFGCITISYKKEVPVLKRLMEISSDKGKDINGNKYFVKELEGHHEYDSQEYKEMF